MNAAELKHAAATVFDAAFDPALWVPALERLSNATQSVGAIMLPFSGSIPMVPFTESLGEAAETYFGNGWYKNDLRIKHSVALMRKRGIVVDQDFMSANQMRSSDFYQDFLGRHKLQWFAALNFDAGEDDWFISFQRTAAQGPFTASEQRTLLCIRNQLTTAATLARRLGYARIEGMAAAFEATNSGFLFVSRLGCVVVANRKAEMLIDGTLRIVAGELLAASHDENAALQRQIALASGLLGTSAPVLPDAIFVSRPDRRGLILRTVPLPLWIQDCFAPAVAMILIADPEEKQQVPDNLLHRRFGLTKSEVAMACWLAEGRSVEDFAEERQIATGTARQISKQVLAKTGTHRQSELVALVKDIQAAIKKIGG